MKRIFYFLAAVAALASVSCSKSDEINAPVENKLVPATISAVVDNTKASADVLGKITWEEGDEIAVVLNSNEAYTFTLVSGAGTNTATFSGLCPEGSIPAEFNKAIYPASAYADGNVTVASEQNIAADATCDPSALILNGVMDSESLHFAPAVGGVQFDVPAGVSSVALSTDKGTFSATVPAAGKYFIFVPEGEYKGISAIAVMGGNTYGYTSTKNMTVSCGKILNLGDLSEKVAPVTVITDAASLQAYLSNPATDGLIMNDIDLAGVTLTPCESLEKTLNGLHHSLTNWNATQPLIHNVTANGAVANITVDNTCNFTVPNEANNGDEAWYAYLVGRNDGIVGNCINNAPITLDITDAPAANFKVAGLVGGTTGSDSTPHYLANCENNGAVTVRMKNMGKTLYCGGVTGQESRPTVENCKNTADVKVYVYNDGEAKSWSNVYLGGTLGSANNSGSVKNCENTGEVYFYLDKPQTGAYPNVGGVTSYTAAYLTDCVNRGNVSFVSGKNVSVTRPAVGGVAGYISKKATGCNNYGKVLLSGDKFGATTSVSSGGTGGTGQPCVGGVFGNAGHVKNTDKSVAELTVAIEDCHNYGTVELINPNTTTWVGIGGVVGYYDGAMTNCSNEAEGLVKVTMGGGQTYSGGVVGVIDIGSKSSFTNCHNKGKVWYVADNSNALGKESTRSYAAGILGAYQAGSKYTMTNCSNTGIIESDNESVMIIGGLAGAWNGHMTGCSSTGSIIVKGVHSITGYIAEIGAISGYANTATYTWENNTVGGTITIENASGAADVGTVFGAQGGAATIAGVEINTVISAPGCNVGYVIGSTRAAAVTVTLGAEDKPVTISPKCSLNGVAASETTIENKLAGRLASGATINATNVIIGE